MLSKRFKGIADDVKYFREPLFRVPGSLVSRFGFHFPHTTKHVRQDSPLICQLKKGVSILDIAFKTHQEASSVMYYLSRCLKTGNFY